ncbi:DUF5719 family protein [Cellulomonas cellasea]|uniref:Secreted protein n=1 Tax=Cellulomonas cellasea TaxID=43670 RepID=A0A7W4YAT7_9CELL|nr:DUF5719 family protein [Cellulomonas cellasea]MBB2922913.1 hypothetical protein [Cellulomonas cellasea]
MSARTWPGRVGRVVTGAAVLLLTAGVVLGADRLPTAALVDGAPAVVEVAPPRSTLVCAGPLILPDDTGAGDSAFDPTPVEPVARVDALTAAGARGGAAAGALTDLGTGDVARELTPDGAAAVAGVPDPRAPLVVRAEPVDGRSARVAAVTSSVVTEGDLRGLSAATCQRPGVDLWLVGGSTALESSASLVLTNPGTTPSDVDVELWGPSGRVELAGGARQVVAPGSERVLVLPAVAAEQRRVVVHVVASGGSVTAHLQESRLAGFTPAGTDLVVPGHVPSTRQVVAGVSVLASAVGEESQAVLRVLAPGTEPASVRLTMLGPDGVAPLPGTDALELAPGEVTDVPLGGLPAGAYTAVVDADVPVVAAATTTRPGLPGELDDTPVLERAWSASSVPGVGGLAALPEGVAATTVVAAVAEGDDPAVGRPVEAVLRAFDADGGVLGEQDVTLAPGRSVAVPAAAGTTGVELVVDAEEDPDVRVAWGVVLEVGRPDGTLLSVLLPAADAPTGSQVRVRAGTRLGLG